MKSDIRAVAKQAGVSIGTVSNVVHGHPSVNPSIRTRVLEAIADLRYEPSRVAQGLRLNRSKSLGLILSDLRNPFFTQIAAAVEETVSQAGYDLVLATSSEDIEKERRAVTNLTNRKVDGVIMAPAPGDHAYLCAVLEHGVKIVLTNRRLPALGIPAVYSDHAAGAALAMEHLFGHGHRHIGIVVGLRGLSATADQLRGIRRAVRAHAARGLSVIESDSEATLEGGQKAAHGLVAARVTAILSLSTLSTLGTIMALQALGTRIPQDVALIGCSDHEWCPVMNPPLTMIHQQALEIGREAARWSLELIRGAGLPGRTTVVLPTTLNIRQSCGCPRWQAEHR